MRFRLQYAKLSSMRRRILLIIWLLSDLLVFLGTYSLAYFIRVGWIFSSDFPFSNYIKIAILVAPVWLAILIGTRTFALMRKQMSIRTLAYIVFASIVAVSLFVLTYYFIYGLFFSRLLLIQALILSAVFTWGWHLLFGLISRSMMRSGEPQYPTLIVGATREAAALIKAMTDNKSPLTPVAILDGHGTHEKEISGVPVVGKLNKLEDVLREKHITHLIQCSDLEQSLNLLSACRNHKIAYMLLPSVLGIVEGDERMESLEGRQVAIVRPKESPIKWFFR